jgi:TolA-binding protein
MLKGLRENRVRSFLAFALVAGPTSTASAAFWDSEPSAPSKEEFYTTAKSGQSSAEQKAADDIRLQTIASIETLLKQKKADAGRTFELHLRLAELYTERHDYLRDVEISQFETDYDRWGKNGKKGKEPQLNNNGSKAELTRAANSYRELVRLFPKHNRTDEALYALAKTLVRLGNNNAELYFSQLLENHKNSALVPDTYIAMGDYYFDNHNINKSIDAYKNAMNFKEHPFYTYAVFKLGWAYYNAPAKSADETDKNLQKALLSFKLVVHIADKDKRHAGRIDLRTEALKDLIMVWADLGDTESAWTYFQEIGEKQAFFDLLERLGWVLSEQGKFDKSIETYTRLLKEAPARENNPNVYKRLLALHDQTNQSQKVVETLKNMQGQFLTTSDWTKANSQKPEILADATETVRSSMHRYGTLYHKQGIEGKRPAMRQAAESIYTMYLANFASTPEAYDVRYYAADLQFDAGQFEAAAANYLTVSKQRPKDGKYTKDAALNAVVAADKMDEKQKYPEVPPRGKVPAPISLPGPKKLLVDTIDNFIALLPDDKQAAGLAGEAAEVMFRYGHYEDAIKRYEWVIDRSLNTELGVASTQTILGYFIEHKAFDKAIDWCEGFNKSPRSKSAKLVPVVTKLHKDALYLRALDFESRKMNADAGHAFMRYHKEFPSDANADKALYNATQNFYRSAMVEEAVTAGQKFVDQYPTSKFGNDVLADLGTTHEALGQFEPAARYFYSLSTKYRNDPRASRAMFNAATLWRGLHDYKNATKAFDAFVRIYPRDPIAVDALKALAEIQEKEQVAIAALDTWQRFIDHPQNNNAEGKLEAEARMVDIRTRQLGGNGGKTGLVDLRRKLIAKDAPAALEARRIVATIMFDNLDREFNSFVQDKFSDPNKIIVEAQNKQAKLVDLVGRFQAVAAVGSPEMTVATLYRLGQLHEAFYKQLFDIPNPSGMSEKDVFKFRSDIEAAAFPLRDQAYQFYETAFKRSQEVETFTEWTQKTYAKMSELSPSKHPQVRAKWLSPTYTSHDLYRQNELSRFYAH